MLNSLPISSPVKFHLFSSPYPSYGKHSMMLLYVQTTVPGARQGHLCPSSSPSLECLPPHPHLSMERMRVQDTLVRFKAGKDISSVK